MMFVILLLVVPAYGWIQKDTETLFPIDLSDEPLELNVTTTPTAVVSFHLWNTSDPVAKLQIEDGTVQLANANYICSSNITLTQTEAEHKVWMISFGGNVIKFYLETVLVGMIDLEECENFTEFGLHGIKFNGEDTATMHYRKRPVMEHGKSIHDL
eukprot:sb/3473167/